MAGKDADMKTDTPLDPILSRRAEPLVPVGYRVTREMRDGLNSEARRRKVDASAIVRGLIEQFLQASRG